VSQGAGRDGQVELAAAGPSGGLVEAGREGCLLPSKGDRGDWGKQRLLSRELLLEPRPSAPLVQNERREEDPSSRWERVPVAREVLSTPAPRVYALSKSRQQNPITGAESSMPAPTPT